jgi:hypothetical protein
VERSPTARLGQLGNVLDDEGDVCCEPCRCRAGREEEALPRPVAPLTTTEERAAELDRATDRFRVWERVWVRKPVRSAQGTLGHKLTFVADDTAMQCRNAAKPASLRHESSARLKASVRR